MAKKAKTVFVCQKCGYESPTWMGQCVCGAWNSFVEEKAVVPAEEDNRRRSSKSSQPSKLREVGTKEYKRIDTGIHPFMFHYESGRLPARYLSEKGGYPCNGCRSQCDVLFYLSKKQCPLSGGGKPAEGKTSLSLIR